MPMKSFSHVNVRTSRLAEMVAFYGDVLGMHPGPRPSFSVGGAWLYLGKNPYIHLVEMASEPRGGDPKIEHYAFEAEDMSGFLGKLKSRGIAYSVDNVPDFPIVQVNFHDPDENHIHVDFHSDEASGLT